MSRRLPLQSVDVVILAGGRGTRLRAAVPGIPKVLAPVAGRPFLDHLLDHLRSNGARRMILALGHLHGLVERHLQGVPDVSCSVEPRPLGTGGALRSVLRKLRSRDVLVLNGDSFVRTNLGRFVEFHRQRRARVTVLLAGADDASRFGRVTTDRWGRVTRFGEKDAHGSGNVNAGIYLFQREAVRAITAGREVSLEKEVFPALRPGTFFALRTRGSFIDIGTPRSWRAAAAFLRSGGA